MRRRRALAVIGWTLAGACGDLPPRVEPGYTDRPGTPTPSPTFATLSEIVRSGRIGVGLNVASSSLIRFTGTTYTGLHWLLAQAIARDLGLAVDPRSFNDHYAIFDAGRRALWDIAFSPRDGAQVGIAYSNPYMSFEWTYLVADSSLIRRPADADRPGYRIAVSANSRLEAYLKRTLTNATVVPADAANGILLVNRGQAEVVGNSLHSLAEASSQLSGFRILDAPVLVDPWAIAVADARQDLLTFARDWVEQAKASGLLADLIARSGIRGIAVAPAGP